MSRLIEVGLPDGTMLLRSSLLVGAGFDHGFSSAVGAGGTAFDLSSPGHSPMGTDADVSRRNIEAFVEAVSSGTTLATATQVHGRTVVDAADARGHDADAVYTDDPRRLVAVRTADCVPILIGCRRLGHVVAVHAGWRGLVADVPGAAVQHLATRGSRPEDLVAAIGPAIGVAAFEIGPEVADAWRAAGLGDDVVAQSPRPHADLHAAARRRLVDAGIAADAIDGESSCTASNPRFFSHRRDAGRTGRHLAAIRCWHPVP